MRIRLNSALAIACLGLATLAVVSGARAENAPRRIALKSGESTELGNYYFVHHCRSIMIGTPVLDVLEGPEELSAALKPGMKIPAKCTKQVLGGSVVLTAKEIKAQKEAKLTIRLKFKTTAGERQKVSSYSVSLFP